MYPNLVKQLHCPLHHKPKPTLEFAQKRAPHQLGGLTFPPNLSGTRLSFLTNAQHDIVEYDPIPMIPSAFWSTRVIETIPTNKFYRKRLMYEVLDTNHMEICNDKTFHVRSEITCICTACGKHAHPYHAKYCIK